MQAAQRSEPGAVPACTAQETHSGHEQPTGGAATPQVPNRHGACDAQDAARIGHLVRTIEHAVIPKLAQAHRPCEPATVPLCAAPTAAEVHTFVTQLMAGCDAHAQTLLSHLRRRGMTVEALYLDFLAPAARVLGDYWDNDDADFATVTVALGQLQRLLRDLGPDFGADQAGRAHARRVLLAQPPHEQHSFGLSMVAEFFRRDGWVVEGGVGTSAADPAQRVQSDWYDAVGFSVGSQTRLRWLREKIAAVRLSSRNPGVVVIVGGPLFVVDPALVAQVGADGSCRDAKGAPALAANLVEAASTRGMPTTAGQGAHSAVGHLAALGIGAAPAARS